jgi:hypothetical protein
MEKMAIKNLQVENAMILKIGKRNKNEEVEVVKKYCITPPWRESTNATAKLEGKRQENKKVFVGSRITN